MLSNNSILRSDIQRRRDKQNPWEVFSCSFCDLNLLCQNTMNTVELSHPHTGRTRIGKTPWTIPFFRSLLSTCKHACSYVSLNISACLCGMPLPSVLQSKQLAILLSVLVSLQSGRDLAYFVNSFISMYSIVSIRISPSK